jgi:hypothetical protein
MCHLFHVLSQSIGARGPYSALLSDFGDYDPNTRRKNAVRREIRDFNDEEAWSDFGSIGELQTWANNLDRYQLVFFSNFLTTPSLLDRFKSQITNAFGDQRPGGLIVVMGADGSQYRHIYESLEEVARKTGHKRIHAIPDKFDDSFRKPFVGEIKSFQFDIWQHIAATANTSKFDQKGYPKYWDKAVGIESLKSFAVRVFRRGNTALRSNPAREST